MIKLKFIVSLLLALGLVACPDDEGDDETKITLKFDGLKDFAQGASPAGFKVTINKDDKVDKESKLKVKVEIACDSKKASKESTASEGVASFSASDFSGITWTGLAKDKECTATATAEGAEKATMKFKVTEAASDDEDDDDTDTRTPKFNPVALKIGQQFKIDNGATKKIKLASSGCDDTDLYKVIDTTGTKSLEELTAEYTIKDGDAFFVSGNVSCKVVVTDITGEKTLSAQAATDAVAITRLTLSDANIVLNIARTVAANRAMPLLFVKKDTGPWVHATISDWEDTSETLDSGIAKHADNDKNHVWLRTNGHWRYAVGE